MGSNLWRYYLENDAAKFRRLLARPGGGGVAPTGIGVTTIAATSSKKSGASGNGNGTITRQALRELDSLGRNVLHLACSDPEGLPFVDALLEHPYTDPSVPDAESGWTAMHRALYHGNISAVRSILAHNPSNWGIVKIKDHAGDSPFEVFGGSIQGIERLLAEERGIVVEEDQQSDDEDNDERSGKVDRSETAGGDEIFMFGSNKNLSLGFPDEDDRSYPERPQIQRPRQLLLEQAQLKYFNSGERSEDLLDASTLFSPLHFRDIQLSKLHTAVLTSDPHSNLFICGFGHGGRLGFGDQQSTQFTLRPLSPPLLPPKRVESVALGLDHTVAVLEGGEVWTWGGNKWGQLGYALQQKTTKEDPIQTTPRQVFNGLKREIVIGCAASRIHTAVFTATSLFTFGKNEGQLGILDSSDARTLASQPTARKVAASFLAGTVITQVTAIDKATAVLLENHEVWILAGYGYSRLSFPIERVVGLYGMNITRYDNKPNFIRKITGGGDTLCALSRTGDAFTLDVESCLKERAEKGAKVGWTTTRAWSLRKTHMAVRDADVGEDGSIIVCTESGSVWKRVKRAKMKEKGFGTAESGRYKFDRVPGLTRITSVKTNKFGAFAAIRRDTDIMKVALLVHPQMLWSDVAGLLSFREAFLKDNSEIGGGDDGHVSEAWGYGPKPRPEGYQDAVLWFMKKDMEQELRDFLIRLPLRRGTGVEWDMTISTDTCHGVEIPIHKVLLIARSPVFRTLLGADPGEIGHFLEFQQNSGSNPRLILKGVDLLTVLNLVYYLYIDTVIDLWHQRGTDAAQTQKFKVLRTELAAVASALGLTLLENSVGRMNYPARSLNKDFEVALNTHEFVRSTDLIIELAKSESIRVHSAIMKARCPFFDALYGGGADGRWLLGRRGDGEAIKVDMKHVSKPVMEAVVTWLYTDWGPEGFDGVRVGVKESKIDDYLDYVMDVMSVANELMLERLSQVCQKVLGNYVNTRNAAQLLMAVSACSETGFKDMCMQYICLNIETMLENHLLDDLDEDLMSELNEVIKDNQRRCHPKSRAGRQEEMLLEKYPSMVESSAKEKKALIAFYAQEDELAMVSTLKKAGSYPLEISSTQQLPNKARRKSGKEGKMAISNSPLLKPSNTGGDLMFHMDDEDASLSAGRGNGNGNNQIPSPPSSLPKPDEGIWFNSKGKEIASPQSQNTRQPALDPVVTPKSFPKHTPLTPEGPASKSWRATMMPDKLPLKEILGHASPSTGKSNITLGLSSSTPEKISQKERKRQQQLQSQQPAGPEIALTPEKPMPKMWQTPTAVSRVSLKEVLIEESSPTTSRATAARPGPSRVEIQRSMSTPPQPITRASTQANIPTSPPPTPHKLTPQKTPSTSTTAQAQPQSASAFVPPTPSPRPQRPEATLHLSLADIMSQEEVHKEIMRDHVAKRSLQEIQAEQEFLRWWEAESEKVKLEAEKAEKAATRESGRGRGGSRGSRGGGESGPKRGGRRGRGGGGGEGGRGRRSKGESSRGAAVVAGQGS
ncbi:hypothetical protein P167DRAFT_499246 [Morchella conica CCBAS932]|uniref:BTB domain-containing protein n=1 Tax=Morchella conica CCBAS932 TaxID=1392247 RepID=A0A3N4L1N7_9PEZI|nr:hypothetical protein P167DRAFT_499246 [Morchella conica CCBAS932]